MANDYYSRLARKQPILGLRCYPTAAEVGAILRGKRQANGSYLCPCPCGLHRRGDSIRASASRTVGAVGQSFIALAAATFATSLTR